MTDPDTRQAAFKLWLDRGRNSVLVSFVLLALWGGYAVRSSAEDSDRRLYRSQIEACERSNDVRREVNARAEAYRRDIAALRLLLLDSTHHRAEVQRLSADGFQKVPLVACKKVVHRP